MCLSQQLLTLFDGVVDVTNQVERCFGILIYFTIHDHIKATDRLVDGHQYTFQASELLSHMEGLGQEALYLTGTCYGHLVFVAQLIQTQDGDDILQFLITLQDQLNPVGRVVVGIPYDEGG